MKLTSDSAGKTSNAHGSAISLFPLKEARRLPGAWLRATSQLAVIPDRPVMPETLFNCSPRAAA